MNDQYRESLEKIAKSLSLMDLDRAQWVFKEEKIRRIREGNYQSTFDEGTGTYQRDREVAYGKE